MTEEASSRYFPFDLFDPHWLGMNGGEMGARIARLAPFSLHPPYPWGQWLYGQLLQERGAGLGGDIVECGVGRGGMSLFLGTFARQIGRKVYSLDSFAGLPAPNPVFDNPYFRAGDYSADAALGDLLERFRAAIIHEGLAETIVAIPGFFKSSLHQLPAQQPFSFVHVDVDLYHSCYEVLDRLFPRIVDGGILVIDDFFHQSHGPARAAREYFSSIGYAPLYQVSFPYSVVIVKGQNPPPAQHRAIDGNHYSLRLLRKDQVLCKAIHLSLDRAEAAVVPREAENARRLYGLLESGRDDASSDIYEYWRALADFWDAIDAGHPDDRAPIVI